MKQLMVVAGVLQMQGRTLLARRGPGGPTAGLWEFPGGKVEPGEDPRAALRRELFEELGIRVEVGPVIEVTSQVYSNLQILLLFYQCQLLEGEPQAIFHTEIGWFSPDEMIRLPMGPGDRPLLCILQGQ